MNNKRCGPAPPPSPHMMHSCVRPRVLCMVLLLLVAFIVPWSLTSNRRLAAHHQRQQSYRNGAKMISLLNTTGGRSNDVMRDLDSPPVSLCKSLQWQHAEGGGVRSQNDSSSAFSHLLHHHHRVAGRRQYARDASGVVVRYRQAADDAQGGETVGFAPDPRRPYLDPNDLPMVPWLDERESRWLCASLDHWHASLIDEAHKASLAMLSTTSVRQHPHHSSTPPASDEVIVSLQRYPTSFILLQESVTTTREARSNEVSSASTSSHALPGDDSQKAATSTPPPPPSPLATVPLTPPCGLLRARRRDGSDAFCIQAEASLLSGYRSSDYYTLAYSASPLEGSLSQAEALFRVPPSTDNSLVLPTKPLEIDVVVTYADGSLAAFRDDASEFYKEYAKVLNWTQPFSHLHNRFRELGELRYALRSVLAHFPKASDNSPIALRYIHLVVADRTHVPAWLNASHPTIRVITHAELVKRTGYATTAAEEADTQRTFLPTFNSNAIETYLHLIPGLTRFFVYMNNDMFLGRRLSFWDLFQPVSPLRVLGPKAAEYRQRVLFAEPRLFAEDWEGTSCRREKRQPPYKGKTIRCPGGPPERHPVTSDSILNAMKAYNRRLMFDNFEEEISVMTFAHAPVVFDKRLLATLLEVVLANSTLITRRSRFRTPENIWVPFIYRFYASWLRKKTLLTMFDEILTDSSIINEALHTQLHPHFRYHPTGTTDPRNPRGVPPLSHHWGHSTIVMLKGNDKYYFAMVRSMVDVQTFENELHRRHPVFVGMNDDLSFLAHSDRKTNNDEVGAVVAQRGGGGEQMHRLFAVASGMAPEAPWEIHSES